MGNICMVINNLKFEFWIIDWGGRSVDDHVQKKILNKLIEWYCIHTAIWWENFSPMEQTRFYKIAEFVHRYTEMINFLVKSYFFKWVWSNSNTVSRLVLRSNGDWRLFWASWWWQGWWYMACWPYILARLAWLHGIRPLS